MNTKKSLLFFYFPAEDEVTDAVSLIQQVLYEEEIVGSVIIRHSLPEFERREGIESKPALKLDDEVVLQGRDPTREDLYGIFARAIPGYERSAEPRRIEPARLPETLDEAVEIIIGRLNDEELADVAAMTDDDLISAHFGWGMGIRNEFDLWRNDRLVRSCDAFHPDDASTVIMKAVRAEAIRLAGK